MTDYRSFGNPTGNLFKTKHIESPIVERTISMIRAGQYGLLSIQEDSSSESRVCIKVQHHQVADLNCCSFGVEELRHAIFIMERLADFLEEKGQ